MTVIEELTVPPEGKATGCLPRVSRLGEEFPVYESKFSLIPRTGWPELIEEMQGKWLDGLVQKIKDQGSEGACASNGGAQAVEVAGVIEHGADDWVELSAMSLYKRVGRSDSSGSTIDGNLHELRENGILPVDTPENRERFEHVHPPRGFHVPLPRGWPTTGKLFAIDEWFDVASFDGLLTGLFRGFGALYGRKGHAIYGARPVWKSGRFGLIYANSWDLDWRGADWLEPGFGVDWEWDVAPAIPRYGAWLVRSRVIPDFALAG